MAGQPFAVRCGFREDLEYGNENNCHHHISFQLQDKLLFWKEKKGSPRSKM